MPGGDRTGPMGMGPMTGRGAGLCAGYPVGGWGNRGGGFGRGMGLGRGLRWGVPAYGAPVFGSISVEQQQALLQQQAAVLQQQLESVQQQLNQLKQSDKS